MKDNIFKYRLDELVKAQKELREKEVFKINKKNYKEYEEFILGEYRKSVELMDKSLKEICALNKTIKKAAINILIESMLDDKEYDLISHINTCIESKGVDKD